MKDYLYSLLMRTVGGLAARGHALGGTVFCFHSITPARAKPQRESGLSVSDEFIRLLVTRLKQLDIPIVSLDEAIARKRSGRRERFAALTFDDGYRDNGEVLHPLMERERVPYTIFVTSGLVDGTMPLWWDSIERLVHAQDAMVLEGQSVSLSPDRKAAVLDGLGAAFKARDAAGQRALLAAIGDANPALATTDPYGSCLSWDMLRAMNASPYLTVGAHTRTHPMLSHLSPDAIRDELARSKEEIADRIGCPVDYLAYPFGQPFEYGPDAPGIAQDVGYAAAFTTSHGDWFDPACGLFTLPRVLIANKARHPDIPLAYMSPLPRRLKSLVGAFA